VCVCVFALMRQLLSLERLLKFQQPATCGEMSANRGNETRRDANQRFGNSKADSQQRPFQ